MKKNNNIKTMVELAMILSALLVGGYMIYFFSSMLIVPGGKYLLMSPYLSFVMTIILEKVKTKHVTMYFNTAFAMIMVMINIFMGASIFITGILTDILVNILPKNFKYRTILGGSAYSGFVMLSALSISKLFIGGAAFERINGSWIIISMLIAISIGLLGSLAGKMVANRMKRSSL